MVVIHGSVLIRTDRLDDALRLSLEHVHRSRGEPGCLSHAVHRDCEEPRRLVFVETWADDASLRKHFQVPASRAFVAELAAMAEVAPDMTIYSATPVVV